MTTRPPDTTAAVRWRYGWVPRRRRFGYCGGKTTLAARIVVVSRPPAESRTTTTASLAGVGGLRTVPPLAVKPGPRGLSRVSPCAALRSATRSDRFKPRIGLRRHPCSGLDSEPPAARRGAGAGRHGLPQQTATTTGTDRHRRRGETDENPPEDRAEPSTRPGPG